jgi:hydroxymethylglutaryl-CoA lyase
MFAQNSTAPFLKDSKKVKLIECPRDAMQGWKAFIPTKDKIDYINLLLKVGFDTLDFGSFVSAKAIPQMADTTEVLAGIQHPIHKTRLLAIVANARGAEEASAHPEIGYLGFPFSVSETFQQMNTGAGIMESLIRLKDIFFMCKHRDKQMVVYLSMAFGNPYKEDYSIDNVVHWAQKMAALGVSTISLSDTVGLATPSQIYNLTKTLVDLLPLTEIGVHLHSRPGEENEKIAAVLEAGSRRIDGALGGYGGCPMAQDELVGNLDTAAVISYLDQHGFDSGINHEALTEAQALASEIFKKE